MEGAGARCCYERVVEALTGLGANALGGWGTGGGRRRGRSAGGSWRAAGRILAKQGESTVRGLESGGGRRPRNSVGGSRVGAAKDGQAGWVEAEQAYSQVQASLPPGVVHTLDVDVFSAFLLG